MITYRIYALDTLGKRAAGQDFACLSDHDALRLAQTLVHDEDQAEIWQANRLVGTVCTMIAVLEAPAAVLPARA